MNKKKSVCLSLLSIILVTAVSACGNVADSGTTDEKTARPAGWTKASHSNDADPDYEVVFPEDKVNQMTITIAPDDWEAMQENMVTLFGAQGTGQQARVPADGGFQQNQNRFPAAGGILPGTANISRNMFPGADNFTRDMFPNAANITRRQGERNFIPGIAPGDEGDLPDAGRVVPDIAAQRVPGMGNMTPENPMWVPATIEFNGLTWTNVGVRYKGNSSLTSGWRSGSLKMPLKLDFDEFEDDYPEIENQRFYGFKQLSLSNVFNDATYMHDVLASDILEEAGLPSAKTAYYEVFLDYGEGPVNLGLYVVIEVIDDTVIDRVFGDDSGNIYEADGRGVSLAQGTYNLIESSFLKENNTKDADWSDIEALYSVINSANRTADAEAWRNSLESVFDIDVFLRWLGISAIIQHWDTYGSMTHNFYLYNNPETGQLTWISWDHNQVLAGGGGIGAPNARAVVGVRAGRTLSLGRDEVTDQWPLIRYLLDDPVYHERYLELMSETLDGAFDPDTLKEKVQELAILIAPYVGQDNNTAAFQSAVSQLLERIEVQYNTSAAFLDGENR